MRLREQVDGGPSPVLDLVLAQLDAVELGRVDSGPDLRRQRVTLARQRRDRVLGVGVGLSSPGGLLARARDDATSVSIANEPNEAISCLYVPDSFSRLG